MNVQEFIVAAEKLFYEDEEPSDTYIINRLSSQRTKLIGLINQLDKSGDDLFSVRKETVVRNVRDLYDVLIGSVMLFLKGQFGESQEKIYGKFFDRSNRSRRVLPAKSIEAGASPFFRIRSSGSYGLYDRKGMFHIPFENRGAVGNQRFSMSGYPCLYLGSSVYCCWEETDRPDIDMFNVASFRNTKPLHFIDLTIPATDGRFFDEEFVYQMVLPLACSLKVVKGSDTFKSEYIIPQNVLGCIIRRNRTDNIRFDGVMYTSSIYGRKQCLFADKDRMVNYVIPIKTNAKSGLCVELVNSFHLSEPTSMLIERLKENVRDTFAGNNGDPCEDIYENTTWGITEERLLGRAHSMIE